MVTMAMVDSQFDPLRGKIVAVNMNVTGAAEHAPAVE